MTNVNVTEAVRYGLQHIATGKLAQVRASSNDGCSDCCETEYLLTSPGYGSAPEWLVEDVECARKAHHTATDWYNAEYERPNHAYDYKPAEYRVVRVVLVTTVEVV